MLFYICYHCFILFQLCLEGVAPKGNVCFACSQDYMHLKQRWSNEWKTKFAASGESISIFQMVEGLYFHKGVPHLLVLLVEPTFLYLILVRSTMENLRPVKSSSTRAMTTPVFRNTT